MQCMRVAKLRDGVNEKHQLVADMSSNGGGGNPLSATFLFIYFFYLNR